jgi:hypothetical protein
MFTFFSSLKDWLKNFRIQVAVKVHIDSKIALQYVACGGFQKCFEQL